MGLVLDNRISIAATSALIIRLKELGVEARDHRLRVLSAIVGRKLSTTKDITTGEYDRVVTALDAKMKEVSNGRN